MNKVEEKESTKQISGDQQQHQPAKRLQKHCTRQPGRDVESGYPRYQDAIRKAWQSPRAFSVKGESGQARAIH
jgi:hypothetical protein